MSDSTGRTREGALSALALRLKTHIPELNFVTRTFVDYDSLLSASPEQFPAVIVMAERYRSEQQRGVPPKKTVYGRMILYVKPPEQQTVGGRTPETDINDLIEKIEAALQRSPLEPVTDMTNPFQTNLGGACQRCWLGEEADVIQGDISGQAAAVLPFEILL